MKPTYTFEDYATSLQKGLEAQMKKEKDAGEELTQDDIDQADFFEFESMHNDQHDLRELMQQAFKIGQLSMVKE